MQLARTEARKVWHGGGVSTLHQDVDQVLTARALAVLHCDPLELAQAIVPRARLQELAGGTVAAPIYAVAMQALSAIHLGGLTHGGVPLDEKQPGGFRPSGSVLRQSRNPQVVDREGRSRIDGGSGTAIFRSLARVQGREVSGPDGPQVTSVEGLGHLRKTLGSDQVQLTQESA